MEYQKAVDILRSLLDKYKFKTEEKKAIDTAIGMMAWGTLAEGNIKKKKTKRENSTKW